MAVEYDSDMFHAGSKRIAHDSKRRNVLLSAGIAVVTVTTAQINDAREIDEIVRVVSRALGQCARASMKGLVARRHDLRRILLPRASLLESKVGSKGEGAAGQASVPCEHVDP